MSLAAAIARDGFSFAGDLYAEASGHNRHRRAAVSELKEHFKSGSDKDHPAHWFEAQLIHYGLQPSKTKSVARMRLFDAVNAGKLAVPSHIKKLEAELKKEWTKNEREAKKAVKTAAAGLSSSSAAAGKKRKADASNVDMTINVGGINITVSANNASASSSAAKKAKNSATSTASSKPEKGTPKSKASSAGKPAKDSPKPKSTAAPKPPKDAPKPKKASAASKAKPPTSAPSSSANTSATPAKKQTPRRGGLTQGPSRGSTLAAPTGTHRSPLPGNCARRSGAFAARGRIHTSSAFDSNNDLDEPPPPYQEYDYDSYSDHDSYSDRDGYDDSDGNDDPPPSSSLQPLGLLNGRYDISSREVTGQWGYDNFDLVLTLSGRELWGKFDLGVVSGILHFDERPWESSGDLVPFTWRGREREGQIRYGNNNRGWIKFLGGGRIEGELDYMGLDFGGERLQGQGMRSGVDAQSMRREWNGYSEDEYERLNRARWG